MTNSQRYRLGTINLYYRDELYLERMNGIFTSAKKANLDTVLVQEVSEKFNKNVCEIAASHGYTHYVLTPARSRRTKTKTISAGIYSKHPLEARQPLDLTMLPGSQPAAVATTIIHGYEAILISVHYAWGAENGQTRLKQSIALSTYARRIRDSIKGKNTLIFVGGTFNDLPYSDTIRYLTGQKASEDIPSTYWTDLTAGTQIEGKPTSIGNSYWHHQNPPTGRAYNPDFIPNRTVDYLFGYGWLFGEVGSPLKAEFFGDGELDGNIPLTDHKGVASELWIPVATAS